jgi:hypothetical protein
MAELVLFWSCGEENDVLGSGAGVWVWVGSLRFGLVCNGYRWEKLNSQRGVCFIVYVVLIKWRGFELQFGSCE